MANFKGMDSDQVRGLANNLHREAGNIGNVITQVDRLVNGIPAIWKGKDATDFIGWWRDQHRKHLVDLQQKLDGLSQSAKNNADEQDRASS